MIRTYGLTHIALAVRDLERSLRFYESVFGVTVAYRDTKSVQLQTPGSHDVIVLEEGRVGVGQMKGVSHFGFRLVDPKDIDAAVEAVRQAGGTIVDRGEFAPGEPYLFAKDPDGYTIEVWFE